MEGRVTQNNHALFELPNEPLKGGIRDIGGGTRPPHDQPPLIEQQTECAPDNPAMMGETFAAALLWAPALPDGMDQLNAIRVNDTQHGRRGQEDLRPVLMGREEAQEPGALGEPRKQGPIVARQPAIERTIPHAFEGMQEPQCYDFTGPQDGVGVFGTVWQMVIDLTE